MIGAALGAVGGAGGGGYSNTKTEKTDVSSSSKNEAAVSLGDRVAAGQHGPIITVSGGDAKVQPDGGSASTSGSLPWIIGGIGVVVLVVVVILFGRKG